MLSLIWATHKRPSKGSMVKKITQEPWHEITVQTGRKEILEVNVNLKLFVHENYRKIM